ncbi:MAG TPA: peptide deformylase [Bacteroidota bacterium]|nr:peptide deformylase [Bacteroidota bacterium]
MAVREILLLGNPRLREPSKPVGNFPDADVRSTVSDLKETLADFRQRNGFGRGIAAPQIGSRLRIIVIQVDKPLPLINPQIVRRSRQMMTLWDDCFSFPDIMVKVKRNISVDVKYRDEKGKECMMNAEGGISELLQHEIDHLDGILAIDRALDSRHIILRSEWKKLAEHESAVRSL